MADKNIGALPQLQTLDDTSSFVVEQQGEAGRVTGAQFKAFWQAIMREDLAAADQALANAQAIYDTISARRPRWWFTDVDAVALGEFLSYTDIRGPETPSAETVSEGDYLVFTQTNQIAYCSPNESLVGVTTSIGTMENLGAIKVQTLPTTADLNAAAYTSKVKSIAIFQSSDTASGELGHAPPSFASGKSCTLLALSAFGGWGWVQVISRPGNGIWYRTWANPQWVEIQDEYTVLTSPNGTRFKVLVNDDGTLATEAITE